MPLAEYVTVIESDPNESPACCHGPALLFNRVGKYFFACSACRLVNYSLLKWRPYSFMKAIIQR